MKANRLLILAGGMSSRMKKEMTNGLAMSQDLLQQANTLPKGMIRLGKQGRPFLDYLLFSAAQGGVQEVLLLLNPADNTSQAYFESQQALNQTWGLSICFARQYIPEGRSKPLGTADAVAQALSQQEDWQNERFIVCNSDNIYSVEVFRQLLACPSQAMIDFDSRGFNDDQVRNCAIVKKNEAGFLIDLLEKPNDEEWEIIKKTMPRIGISWNIFLLSTWHSLPLIPFFQRLRVVLLPNV